MILLILSLAIILRIINLNQSLWWDEAINIVYAKSNDFWWFVTKYPIGDFHPPGYFAILWLWGHLSGFSEISSRVPSVIFGILTVFLTYLIGKKLFSKKTGLIAALFMSLAPLHIYYSQEARMYSFAALAVVFSMYSLIRLVSNQRYGLVMYVLSTTLVLYSDYLAYFIIPAQFFWVFIYHKKFLKKIFLSGALFILFWSPWLLVFPQQLAGGQATAGLIEGWRNTVGGAGIREFLLLPVKIITGRISFYNNALYLLLFVILLTPFMIALQKVIREKISSKTSLFWLWLTIPPVLTFFISFFIPVFSYFRFIFILPAFYILTALGVEKFNAKISKVLVVLIVMSGLTASSIYLFIDNFHREDWRGAIHFISKNLDDQTLVIFENNEIPAPARYYSNDLTKFEPGLGGDITNKLSHSQRVYFFEYLGDIYDPKRLVTPKLKNLNFINIKTYNFRGVGFIRLYEK
ncbi:glycosyltransferase family 39 protein [Candidatus Daviesbacteria bacterium]|nr:glycosyltransferase family 39 protein [Candidatus Daviesbacteria bacterium]